MRRNNHRQRRVRLCVWWSAQFVSVAHKNSAAEKESKRQNAKRNKTKKTTQTRKAQQETNKNKHKTTQNKGNGAGQKEWELAEGTKGAMGKKSTRRKMDKVRKEEKKKKQCTNDAQNRQRNLFKGPKNKRF